ncbi:hypothetical protein [Bacteroides sp. 224]|uniref:hypothetical protein n=1 Tax=Bacteroides sp. 224 TaxID=2302936 RepID=UPI0013CFF773|nr:hypothetical protein [Bacteroides sp. 224]NDV66563.1 hypothetical protein [Bacteroides sp. 224]
MEITNNMFFSYYLLALKEALSQDEVNYGFFTKSPSWFYPKELYVALERYEESHYDEFPLLEKVACYFDAKSHNFPTIESVEINIYRDSLIEEAKEIALKIGLEFVV